MKKKKIQHKPVKKWRLSIAPNLRLIVDGTTILVLTTTTYISIFNKDILFMVMTVSIILSYLLFLHKGFYDMRAEMRNKNVTLISFPFARLLIPYKKIKSMEIVDRRWRDYLMGYGCKLEGKDDDIEIYFRSRMSGKVVVIHTKRFKFKRIELTLDSPEGFIEELENKI